MSDEKQKIELPVVVEEYLAMLTRRIRNRRVRRDVLAELRSHFDEALADVAPEDRERTAKELIEDFGDAAALSSLIRRAKKRCRPAWVKFTIRSLQTLGVLILLLIAYSISFWFDKPNPTIDYVAELNEMVRPKVDESQNAAVYYLKAEELLPNPTKELREYLDIPGKAVTSQQEMAMYQWLNEHQNAFIELEKGTAKPYFWYDYQGEAMIMIQVPYLGELRFITKCLCWRIWLIDGDDQEKILRDLDTVYNIAGHLESNTATVIEQLVGIAIQNMADLQTLLFLHAGKIKPDSLPILAQMGANLYPKGYPVIDLRGERMMLMDTLQRTFTDSGLGGGHICPKELEKYYGNMSESKAFDLAMKSGFYLAHPRREETSQKLNEYFDLIERNQSFFPYDRKYVEGIEPFQVYKENLHNNNFLAVLLPALGRVGEMNYRSRVSFQATQTVIALMRYKQEHEHYPDSLAELSPKYLKELPRDPYGPELLVYKKVGEDFMLYSLGVNFKDDDGVHDSAWGEKAKDKAADYVFWPPVKPN